MAVLFALLSLVFAAMNDLVFKCYARKLRSRGLYVGIIGVVWTVVFAGAIVLSADNGRAFTEVTILWGVVSGLFSIVANILLIEAMGRMEAGTCSTVYRLNLAFAAILAFVLLGETVTSMKLLGIVFATAAVACFSHHSRMVSGSAKGDKFVQIGFMTLVIMASLLRAAMGISYKYALTAGADQNGLLAFNGLMWILGGGVYFLAREKGAALQGGRKSWLYGLLSGVLICGIVLFMALALQHGDASIVLPVSQMSFIGTALLGIFFLKERISLAKCLGIVCGIACVLVMSLN